MQSVQCIWGSLAELLWPLVMFGSIDLILQSLLFNRCYSRVMLVNWYHSHQMSRVISCCHFLSIALNFTSVAYYEPLSVN